MPVAGVQLDNPENLERQAFHASFRLSHRASWSNGTTAEEVFFQKPICRLSCSFVFTTDQSTDQEGCSLDTGNPSWSHARAASGIGDLSSQKPPMRMVFALAFCVTTTAGLRWLHLKVC